MDVKWNPWHGCHKISAGCANCFMYSMDKMYDKDSSIVVKNKTTFDTPIKKRRDGSYKYPMGTTFATCFTSDFFLEEADEWRDYAWAVMRIRYDCYFFIITKRIDRFLQCIPSDWGEGYDNVIVACTCEN